MSSAAPGGPGEDDRPPAGRKAMLLRLDPEVHAALARWAADDLRSVNAQVEWLLRRSLAEAGRLLPGGRVRAPRPRPAEDG